MGKRASFGAEKCGGLRWCLDYRKLNLVSKKDSFPLPLMGECLDALHKNVWYSKLDANSAYWQVPLDPESRIRPRLGRGMDCLSSMCCLLGCQGVVPVSLGL